MTVKLNGQLPKSYNGVDVIAENLLEDPKKMRVAIIFFDCPKIIEDTYASVDSKEPIIRIKRIEPIMGDDEEMVKEILLRTYETRVGTDAIPFDAERDAKDNGTHEPLELGYVPDDIQDAEIIDDEPVHGAVKAQQEAEQGKSNVTSIDEAKKKPRKKKASKKPSKIEGK